MGVACGCGGWVWWVVVMAMGIMAGVMGGCNGLV